MLFIKNIRKSRKAFFDKRPGHGHPEISIVNHIPKEHQRLHEHIQQLEIPHNNEVSFELFEFLDQEEIKWLRILPYSERVKKYEEIANLITTWCWDDCMVTHWELRNWEIYSREGWPIAIIKWKYIPLSQIAKGKASEVFKMIMRSI